MTTIHDVQLPSSDPADANEITPPASSVVSSDSQAIEVYISEVEYEMSPQFNPEASWFLKAIEFAKEGLIERNYLE